MNIVKLTPQQWNVISENVHKTVFGKLYDASKERIDYALMCEDAEHTPLGYLTAREMDGDTIYWQFGGGFPGVRHTIHAYPIYQGFVRWTKEAGYKRIYTLVENTNKAYLKFAAKTGFIIVGVKNYKGTVLLEHLLEFEEEK